MIKTPIDKFVDGRAALTKEAADDLMISGTYCPEPKAIQYRIGTQHVPEKTDPEDSNHVIPAHDRVVMSTLVTFEDGTEVRVMNSEADGLETREKTLADGSKILVPTHHSQELGLIYAIMKRLCGVLEHDENDRWTLRCEGMGRILNSFLKQATLQNEVEANLKIRKAANRKAAKEAKAKKVAEAIPAPQTTAADEALISKITQAVVDAYFKAKADAQPQG